MLLQTMLRHLTAVVDSAVIKYNRKALENETAQATRVYDFYINAVEKRSTFSSYPRFSQQAIINAGVPVYEPTQSNISDGRFTALMLAVNPSNIPSEYRQRVVEEQRKINIEAYETNGDSNNYYRMLAGLPDIGDSDQITLYGLDDVPFDPYKKYGIEEGIPVHTITDDKIRMLMNDDIINKLISKYPDKKYLRYLGPNRIDSASARRASNFALLKIASDNIPSSFIDKFSKIYEQNREYINTVLYNRSLADIYGNDYDNFMAMCVMFMTIQRMVSLAFKDGIERDLYDWEFIQRLYSAYNIPFIETLSMDTHMTMIKNFNYLLRHKSTDKVLFDLCALLGYTNVQIDRYYLIKDQRFDSNGNPIIVKDADGNIVLDKTYDLYFKSIDMREKNITLALQDSTTTKTYEEVTEGDPLWWDSGDLKNTILEEKFNYYESKYISLNMMYNMSDILFDITYAIGTILAQKGNIDRYGISLNLPRIDNNRTFSLFDTAVFIIAGMCKMNGFDGNIPNSMSSIFSIYGYNRTNFPDLTDSRTIAAFNSWNNRQFKNRRNEYTGDDIIYENVSTGSMTKYDDSVAPIWENGVMEIEDFNTLFANVKNLNESLIEAMWETDDVDMYNAYRALHDTYMTKQYTDEMFLKSDGTVATTYLNYLQDVDQDLYGIINNTPSAELYDILSHAVGRMQEEIESMSNLNGVLDDSETVFKALTSLINFFKSYTVDIHAFNIWYVFDSKYYNAIRLFGKLGLITSEMLTKTEMDFLYNDCAHITTTMETNDSIKTKDNISFIWEE